MDPNKGFTIIDPPGPYMTTAQYKHLANLKAAGKEAEALAYIRACMEKKVDKIRKKLEK